LTGLSGKFAAAPACEAAVFGNAIAATVPMHAMALKVRSITAFINIMSPVVFCLQ
jgi:hypothetical protein